MTAAKKRCINKIKVLISHIRKRFRPNNKKYHQYNNYQMN